MSYFVAMALNAQDDFFSVMKGEKKVSRSTMLGNNSDFFDLTLGVTHYTIRGQSWVGRASGWPWRARVALKNFVKRTQKNLDDLCSNCTNQLILTTGSKSSQEGVRVSVF